MPESSVYHYGQTVQKTLDDYVDDAIARMADQPEPLKAAAGLLLAWADQTSEVRDLLPDLVRKYLEARVKARAKARS